MSSTYMNYHHINTVSLKTRTNRCNDCDNTWYGVLELELIDRDGNDHTIIMFHDVPFTDEQLSNPAI